MRKLSKSESRLLLFFGAAIFLAANLLAARFWLSSRRALQQEAASLKAKIAEDRSWIAAVTDFESASAWIASHPPPRLSNDDASASLVDTVRKSAESHKLGISVESLLPSDSGPDYSRANLQIKLAGTFPGIVRLLFDLQRPDAWRSMDKLTLRSDTTPPNALAEFHIRQYYSTAAPSGPPSNP